MADAVQPLRLVPRPEASARLSQTFACSGIDTLRLASAGLAAAGGPVLSFTGLEELDEVWLDTPDRRILRAGLILRVRGAAAAVARLTPFPGPWPVDGSGDALVQPLAPGPLKETVLHPGPVGSRVLSLVGNRLLESYAELTVRRSLFEGTLETSRIELGLEEIRTARPARPGQSAVCRLTIAGDADAAERIGGLVDSLRAPCDLTTPPPLAVTARELAGVEPISEPDLGSEETLPQMQANALAFVSLRRQARAFLRHEPGTRLGDDPDVLHDMRVAGRRMRAAFSLFAFALPKRSDGLRRELGRLGRILGAVRDLDVQLTKLAEWRRESPLSEAPAFDAIEAVLRERRATARRRLIATFDTVRYERFIARLCAFVRHGPGRSPTLARLPAKTAAPELIGRRYRAVRKIGDRLKRESPPTDFHALRIRAKRLRYALEFHRPLYDGEVAAMIESLTALQDLLGEHQDAFVAVGHLEELAASSNRKLSPRAVFLMGTIAARYGHQADELRRAFRKTYRKIRGRRWKALKSSLAGGATS